MVRWDYYNKFENLVDKYMESTGEGNTKASQIVTSVNKLVYMYYNNGDVYDNTNNCFVEECCNDVSSYANWLYYNTTDKVKDLLNDIDDCYNDNDYELILKRLADTLLDEPYLEEQSKLEKVGSIYKCCGRFEYIEPDEEEDDEWY